jgi:hypothetical protein
MADVVVTINKITSLDTVTAVTASPATEDVANTTQLFTITPTVGNEKLVVACSVANTHGAVSLSVAAGGFHGASAALVLSIPQNTTKTFTLDSSKYLSKTGVYSITATPASGKKLASEHALTFTVIEPKAM